MKYPVSEVLVPCLSLSLRQSLDTLVDSCCDYHAAISLKMKIPLSEFTYTSKVLFPCPFNPRRTKLPPAWECSSHLSLLFLAALFRTADSFTKQRLSLTDSSSKQPERRDLGALSDWESKREPDPSKRQRAGTSGVCSSYWQRVRMCRLLNPVHLN